MSELLVVIGGLALGYAIVSLLLGSKPRNERAPASKATRELKPIDHWSHVLGVDPDAPTDAVRAAYHRASSEYQPDKLDGLGSELIELAQRKSGQIADAYRQALAERGEPE
jgi:DnaJ-domain-containing protein 1